MKINFTDFESITTIIEKLNMFTHDLLSNPNIEVEFDSGASIPLVNPNGYRTGTLIYDPEFEKWEFDPSGYGDLT